MQSADYSGFVVYLLMVFLPGLALGETFRVWRKEDPLTLRAGVAVGIGFSVDALVMFVRSAGVSYFGAGIDLTTIWGILGVSALLFVGTILFRRKLYFPSKPKRFDLWILLVMLSLGALLALYFSEYPIFPQYNSVDFDQHVSLAEAMASGSLSSIPGGILYYGVHYQLASALLLVHGVPMVTVQRTMGFLVLLSPLIVALASSRLFSDEKATLLATAIYSLSATVWYGMVFNGGLYSNFYGVLASLFVIAVVAEGIVSSNRLGAYVVLVLAVGNGYLSHYSFVAILPAILAIPLLRLLKGRKELVRYLVPSLVVLLPAAIALFAYPSIVNLLFQLATQPGGKVSGGTSLSSAFVSIPVISLLATEVTADGAFAALLLLGGVYLAKVLKSRGILMTIPLVWFASILVASPWNISAFRFAFIALVPFTIMAGYGMASLIPERPTKRVRLARGTSRWKAGLVIVIVLSGMVLYGSWGNKIAVDAATNGPSLAGVQQDVFSAIQYLNSSTPSGPYLSTSDWRFLFTDTLIGRQTYYQFYSTPQQAIPAAKSVGAKYIIVTRYVTEKIPILDPSVFPWNNFPGNTNLTQVYSNSDVEIFRI